jgi:phage-related protein
LPKNRTAVLHTFLKASKTVIAALASSDPATRRHAEAFREIGERCFKKWAPDFGK